MKPVSYETRKLPTQTNFDHYKKVLERTHAKLKEQEEDRIADIDIIEKMENDPTFVDTIQTPKSNTIKSPNPAIYYVDAKHIEGLTLGQAATKLGISSRSIAMIKQGSPLSMRSIRVMMDYSGLTLKDLLTPENYKEVNGH